MAKTAAPTTEAEFTATDGTVRKKYYGDGKQPWDFIVEAGWGAPFAAGNVLKYMRRAAAKNGDDDRAKAKWYWTELVKLGQMPDATDKLKQVDALMIRRAVDVRNKLVVLLTKEERTYLEV